MYNWCDSISERSFVRYTSYGLPTIYKVWILVNNLTTFNTTYNTVEHPNITMTRKSPNLSCYWTLIPRFWQNCCCNICLFYANEVTAKYDKSRYKMQMLFQYPLKHPTAPWLFPQAVPLSDPMKSWSFSLSSLYGVEQLHCSFTGEAFYLFLALD